MRRGVCVRVCVLGSSRVSRLCEVATRSRRAEQCPRGMRELLVEVEATSPYIWRTRQTVLAVCDPCVPRPTQCAGFFGEGTHVHVGPSGRGGWVVWILWWTR